MESKRLLVDNDAFVLFAGASQMEQAASLLGYRLDECLRLDALLHMLRKGRSFSRFSPEARASALALCEQIDSVRDRPSGDVLELLVGHEGIDAGEILLYASLAENPSWMLLSGDKRAMRALCTARDLNHVKDAIAGRIACVESVIERMVTANGAAHTVSAFMPVRSSSPTLSVVLSDSNATSDETCLMATRSYLTELQQVVGPRFLV